MNLSSDDYAPSKIGKALDLLRKHSPNVYVTRFQNPQRSFSILIFKYEDKWTKNSIEFNDRYFSKIPTDKYIKVTDDLIDYINIECEKINTEENRKK